MKDTDNYQVNKNKKTIIIKKQGNNVVNINNNKKLEEDLNSNIKIKINKKQKFKNKNVTENKSAGMSAYDELDKHFKVVDDPVPTTDDEYNTEGEELEEEIIEENNQDIRNTEQIYLNQIGKTLDEAEKDKLFEEFNTLKNKWLNVEVDPVENALKNFGLIKDNLNMSNLLKNYDKCLYEAINLQLSFVKQDLIILGDFKHEFNCILESIYYSEIALRAICRINITKDPSYNSTLNDDIGLFRFTPIDYSSNSPWQNVLLYTLDCLSQRGYRKYFDYCYEPVFNDKKEYAYAWKPYKTIKEFIAEICKKEVNYNQWHNLTSGKDGNIKSLSKFLEWCDDPQFQPLKKDRHLFSFNSCLYQACVKTIDPKTNKVYYTDKIYHFNDNISLTDNVVACKHFNVDLDETEYENWYDMPTPCMQKILDYQFKDEPDYVKICETIYALLGRNIYEIGELEDWQVFLFFKGAAGTGKSTIITKILKRFYEADDVGVLSNDGEKQFGLSGFYTKLLYIAPEISYNFSLKQTTFQGMISGEDVVVSVKQETPLNVEWKVPGAGAGNKLPNYSDDSGSMSRRFVVVEHKHPINPKDLDPDLGRNLEKEIPLLIRKCNRAYLDLVNKNKGKQFWYFAPNYFKQTQEKLSKQLNSFADMLNCSKLIFDDKIYIRESYLKTLYTDHCKENNVKPMKWCSDLYDGPLYSASIKYKTNIRYVQGTSKEYPRGSGRYYHGTFIYGLDVNPEFLNGSKQQNEDDDPDIEP